MNDEETQARQLLATATRDMPPGIDLLGGFAAAQRRDRSRQTRKRAALSAGVIAASAAASAIAVTLTVGSAPPALATVTRSRTSTLSQSYHLSQQNTFYVKGQSNNRLHGTCTTEADPARQMLQSSCSGPDAGTTREVGGYTYYSNAAGNRWERIPDADIVKVPASWVVDSFTTSTPQQMLAALEEATTVSADGSASGPGWASTRYAFSGTFRRQVALRGTVTVDQQGRSRALVVTTRLRSGYRLIATEALTFSDLGAPVTVTPPPTDQQFSYYSSSPTAAPSASPASPSAPSSP